QARQARQVVSLKSEKEQVRALGEYLAQLLDKLPAVAGGEVPDATLLEPVNPAWTVAALGAGYDADGDRFVLEARELQEEETGEEAGDEPAVARFHITRAQAVAFVERVRELMQAGRPICVLCQQPKDPDGHVCPRSNGHVTKPRA